MIRPPHLRPGDVVHVVAPSGPVDPANLAAGVAVLRDVMGLDVRMRPDVEARRGYLAGDDGRRLAEWREAASDREARAIFCARGGYGAMHLLPRLEPARLLHPPKWVVGFSDVTVLHAALNRAGLVTLHGPLVTTLGRATPEALAHLRALLFGTEAPAPDGRGVPGPGQGCVGTAVIRPGRAAGTLLGGSLTLLAHLCGTPWLPPLQGAVLFLEDVGEKPYRLDRYLTQLRLAGALDGVRAVVVGHLTACDADGLTGAEVVRELVHALGVPAIEGVAAGHADHNLALPLGSVVTLVAPEPGEEGPPRLLFDPGTAA
ncbi:S66 peptidase family protein [Anaeromyxobacter diazotrophicus]|uniref:Peptidase S66 n=1 Tax=Anaeromyxobacter diazotrophicus TaxID=2590199 RepID=A0A7I9VHZ9_9BACT|nr:LD-carboxypeptidase [Anaeromyxobacter diazotrophicus]GEJ55869.1 peptidase S66 [Anaeromyxobacter diazotrophicus]